MSVERPRTTNPSPWAEDEGCQPPLSNSHAAVDRGGVSVDGMSGKDAGINQESSLRAGARQPAAQASGEAVRAEGAVGVSRSSVELRASKTRGEPRGGTCVNAFQSDEGRGDGWEELLTEWTRIVTPEKVRKLQRTLYRKAKAEPKYRFYSLYGEVCRRDMLEHALVLVSRNGGSAGVQTPATADPDAKNRVKPGSSVRRLRLWASCAPVCLNRMSQQRDRGLVKGWAKVVRAVGRKLA